MRAPSWALLAIHAFALSCVTTGCAAHAYVYRPTEVANLISEDQTVARYAVPRTLPRGELFVKSKGIGSDPAVPGTEPRLHVQLLVFNVTGESDWVVDIRDQLVTLPDGAQVHVAGVKTPARGAPLISIRPGERVEMDLFFDLPAALRSPSAVAEFEFIWQVQTDGRAAAGTVPFARLMLGPDGTMPATVASATN